MSKCRLVRLFILWLAVSGCSGDSSSYRIKIVFPDENARESVDTVALWVFHAHLSSCDLLLDGQSEPDSIVPISRFSTPLSNELEMLIPLDVNPAKVILFAQAQHLGTTLLQSCVEVDLPPNDDLLIIMELRSLCIGDGIERACNNIDDDCDGLIDECETDLDCQHQKECISTVCSAGVCECKALDGTVCDDGLFCTVDEYCQAGQCINGVKKDCSAGGGQCAGGLCDEDLDKCTGSPLPVNTPCEDGLYCTNDDKCDGLGVCIGIQMTCEHLDGICTQGRCDESSKSCVSDPANEGQACNDGQVCSEPDTCQNGQCIGPEMDSDQDGVCDPLDLCIGADVTGDTDADGICNDMDTDDDGDSWSDEIEANCGSNPLQSASIPIDSDADGICDPLDQCSGDDSSGDDDGDGICNDLDTPTDSYQSYKEITILATKVSGSGSHSNFPVLISLVDPDLHDNCQTDGDDIAFLSGGNLLDYEIEFFNRDYSATNAKLVAWVRIPSLSSSVDTTIRMVYGYPSLEASESNPAGVWDTYYKGVWHLSEKPTATIFDSTRYNNDGTSSGAMTVTDQVAGKIDGSLDFDGINDIVNVGTGASLRITNDITIQFWIKGDSWYNWPGIVTKGNWGSSYCVDVGDDSKVTFYTPRDEYGLVSTQKLLLGNWYHIACTRQGAIMRIFINGNVRGSQNDNTPFGTLGSVVFSLPNYMFDGRLDEVRISGSARSQDWLITEFRNHSDPSSFYSVGNAMPIK